jgi:predicted CopG family antitoxin
MYACCMPDETSIRISFNLLNTLKRFKTEKDSYEDVIWDFIEPHLELSEQAKKDIEISKKEYLRGNFATLEEVKKEFGF